MGTSSRQSYWRCDAAGGLLLCSIVGDAGALLVKRGLLETSNNRILFPAVDSRTSFWR